MAGDRLTPFGRVLLLLAAGAALLAVLALGGTLSPWLDVLAHLAPLFAATGLACAVAAVLQRGRRGPILLAAAIAVAASAVLIVPEFTRDAGPRAAPDAPGQIKVIQINALRTNDEVRRVADWLIAQDPDVVTVGEARHDLRDLLIRRGGWMTAGAHGNLMIFTHARYVRMQRPRLPPGAALSFVNATYALPPGPTEVVTTHFDHPTKMAFASQPGDLVGVTAVRPRERMILTGDLNTTPWSAKIRRLDRELGLTRRDRALPTWPAQVLGHRWPLPVLPIDHVYAGPGWATVKVERGPWLGSDHYPLIVTLAPVNPGPDARR